jgi:hypothetical protein
VTFWAKWRDPLRASGRDNNNKLRAWPGLRGHFHTHQLPLRHRHNPHQPTPPTNTHTQTAMLSVGLDARAQNVAVAPAPTPTFSLRSQHTSHPWVWPNEQPFPYQHDAHHTHRHTVSRGLSSMQLAWHAHTSQPHHSCFPSSGDNVWDVTPLALSSSSPAVHHWRYDEPSFASAGPAHMTVTHAHDVGQVVVVAGFNPEYVGAPTSCKLRQFVLVNALLFCVTHTQPAWLCTYSPCTSRACVFSRT